MKADAEVFIEVTINSGISVEDASKDLTDSITEAFSATQVMPIKDPDINLQIYWSNFFRSYSLKCQQRWFYQANKLKDEQSRYNLWFTTFEPVWSAGCNLAKQNSLQSMKQFIFSILEKENKDDREQITKLTNDMLFHLEKEMTKMIAENKESQSKAMLTSLSKLQELEEASFLKKLFLLIKSRRMNK